MKRFVVVLVVLALFGLVLAAPTAGAKPPEDGPKKVWVCHFPGHEAGFEFQGGGTTLDGDYVFAYVEGMPFPNQIEFCEDRGGKLINISVKAVEKGSRRPAA